MTPQAQKIASFLKKIAGEGFNIDSSLFGGESKPFAQNTKGEGVMGKVTDFAKNVGAGLQRGHVGTVAGTGAASLLAGLLAYNLMKKKPSRR